MSENYEAESFDSASSQATHHMKLMIDLHQVRNMQVAANLFASFQLELTETQSFSTSPPTPVNQGNHDTKL